jgi:hypothetical protein
MFLFRNQRLLKLHHQSLIRHTSSKHPVQVSSDLTLNDISRQIVHRFHPAVVDNFMKTLQTVFKSTKHYTLIVSSIHFKAGPELRYLLDWLNQTLSTGQLTTVKVEREGTKREALKNKLILAYKNYWKNKNCPIIGKSEPNIAKMTDPSLDMIVTDILDLIPFETTSQLITSLQLITNSSSSKGKLKSSKIISSDLVTAFFANNIRIHKSHLIHLYPFLQLLDIPFDINREAQSLLKEIENKNYPHIVSLEKLLTRSLSLLSSSSSSSPLLFFFFPFSSSSHFPLQSNENSSKKSESTKVKKGQSCRISLCQHDSS